MAPTVLSNVQEGFRCMREEIFGPVTCVQPFVAEDDAVRMTNSVRYGLCAALFTQNLARAHRTAHELDVSGAIQDIFLQMLLKHTIIHIFSRK